MFHNFQTWRNSGNAQSFCVVFTESNGSQWHINGSKLPYDTYYDCTVTLLDVQQRGTVTGKLQLKARGLSMFVSIAVAVQTIVQFRSLQGVTNVL